MELKLGLQLEVVLLNLFGVFLVIKKNSNNKQAQLKTINKQRNKINSQVRINLKGRRDFQDQFDNLDLSLEFTLDSPTSLSLSSSEIVNALRQLAYY